MNSPDPWRVMLSSPPGSPMVVPAPFYGNPFFGDVTHGRTFVGAEAPAGGITVRKELDDAQVLHVKICVDGKCYETSMDLAPAIAMVMAKLAQWHAAQHAAMPHSVPTTVVVGAIEAAVGAAGDAMVEALVHRHVDVTSGSWLDDIGNTIGGFLREFKGPITQAATAVATYYGGAEAGAAAGKLAGPITDFQANALDPPKTPQKIQKAQQTKSIVDQAKMQAQVDPTAAKALDAAHQAVVQTTVAYHVKDTVQKAAQGDPDAQRRAQKIAQAADQGDPAAQSAMDLAKQVLLQYEQNAIKDLTTKQPNSTTVGGISEIYDSLERLIELHEDFWVRQRATGSDQGSEWLRHRWLPFYNRWQSQLHSFWRSVANDLIDLRREAAQVGIPVPTIAASELGALVQRGTHLGAWSSHAVVGDFWDDVGDAILTVTGTKATNQFIHDNHLEPYVQLAATGVATYYGGPAAGAAANKLSPFVMSLGVDDKKKAAAAQKNVHGVTAAAQQHSPEMAQAVDVAKDSIKNAATAYHAAHIVKRARHGDRKAHKALADLQAAAAAGDPSAQKALQAMDLIHEEQVKTEVSGWHDVVGAVPWYTIVGAAIASGGPRGYHRGPGGRLYPN